MPKKHGKLDWNATNVTPYNIMRLQNCKAYTYRQGEMYPSIRPPQSRCRTDFTDKWISNVAENTGCKPFDPKLYSNRNVAPVENVLTQRRVDKPSSGKYLCSQIKLPKRNLDYSKLTPNDLMRLLNCNPADFRDDEIYPSVRPPVSKCCPALTKRNLSNAVKDSGCERHFDMEKDDVVEVWRQSPNKETLCYYGVGTNIHKPEAVMFNQAICKCLKMVNPKAFKPQEVPQTPPPSDEVMEPPGHAILNRPLLNLQARSMPTVQEAINAVGAFRWVFCPHNDEEPFAPSKPPFPIKKALNMERTPAKYKHEQKHKQRSRNMHSFKI